MHLRTPSGLGGGARRGGGEGRVQAHEQEFALGTAWRRWVFGRISASSPGVAPLSPPSSRSIGPNQVGDAAQDIADSVTN